MSKIYHELSDKSSRTSKERPFKEKKLASSYLSDIYREINPKKSKSIKSCGDFLTFKEYVDGTKKLDHANFCRIRLCPMCSWRLSLKTYGQVSKIMDKLEESKQYRYIFLTLTMKNVVAEDLQQAITDFLKAFNELTHLKKFKKCIVGYFRGLEITYNGNTISKYYDTYHPHIHCILVVPMAYGNTRDNYISQNDFCEMWQNCLKLDYKPICHIAKIETDYSKNGKGICGAVAEVAKYTAKSGDFLRPTITESRKVVSVLDKVLKGRRLSAFGGIMKIIAAELKLDDLEKGELINCDIDQVDLNQNLAYVLVTYKWKFGFVDGKNTSGYFEIQWNDKTMSHEFVTGEEADFNESDLEIQIARNND